MLIDSHCHLVSHRYTPEEIGGLIQAAQTRGVGQLVSLTTSLADVPASLVLSENPSVHTCLGIHPCDVHHAPDDALQQISQFTADPRVCGIGETGLDYYHPAPDAWDETSFRERQQDFLQQHFQLAAAAGLNIAIHTRDQAGCASFEDALAIYQKHHHRVRAVFHCFIGSWENAKRVIDLGGLVAFGGVATFKNARNVCEIACKCPPGSFMVETDAPYLAPAPHRGKRNEPAFVREVAEFLANQRGESYEAFIQHTGDTAMKFFRFRSA